MNEMIEETIDTLEENYTEKINNNKDASFASLFNNPELSDLVICVNSKNTYHSHRLVLASRSEVFKAMLSDKWNQKDTKNFELEETVEAQENFHDFLYYIYSGVVNLQLTNVAGLYTLADKYNIQCLRSSTMQYMSDHIATNSRANQTLNWLLWAQECRNAEFEKKCYNFIINNFGVVVNSCQWLEIDINNLINILKSSDLVVQEEIEVFEAVEKWLLNKEKECLGFLLKSLIPFLRLTQIWPIQLSHLEQHSEIFQRYKKLMMPELLDAYRYQSLPLENRLSLLTFQSSSMIITLSNNVSETESDILSTDEVEANDFLVGNLAFNEMKYKMRTYINKNFCFSLELKQEGDHYGPLTFATSKSSSFLDQALWHWNLKLYYNPNNTNNNKLKISVSDVYNKQGYLWNSSINSTVCNSSSSYGSLNTTSPNLQNSKRNVQIAFLIGHKKRDGFYYKQYKYMHDFTECESFELLDFYKDWNLSSCNQRIKLVIVVKPTTEI
ncbi:unnamed protein product [Gordionus sp. m RMFG-2023]|uniref:galectin-3-binding protein A-like n=1 Tax=Gordionus sp. m RMFG-2023 TaxID=3053472 RepID=UPI0030E5711D